MIVFDEMMLIVEFVKVECCVIDWFVMLVVFFGICLVVICNSMIYGDGFGLCCDSV